MTATVSPLSTGNRLEDVVSAGALGGAYARSRHMADVPGVCGVDAGG